MSASPRPRLYGLSTSALTWSVVYAVAIFATQFGSLRHEVINWDESTFILMASNVLHGHLPYTELFDNKPPMIFLLLAAAMGIFGESLLVVRTFGDLCILISAVAVFLIARRWVDPIAAGLGGLVVVAMHATEIGLPTSSELPATAALMVALYLLIARRDSMWAMAAAGLLISIATLTRLNLGLVAVVFGVYLTLAGLLLPASGVRRWAIVPYCVAGLIPLVLIVLVYWRADAFPELKLAMIDVPLSYATDQRGPMNALLWHARVWLHRVVREPWVYGAYSVLVVLGLAVWGRDLRRQSWRTSRDWHDDAVLGLMLGAILVSVVISGEAFEHYWLQFIPAGAIFAARAFSVFAGFSGWRWICYALVALTLGEGAVESAYSWQILTHPGVLNEYQTVRSAARKIAAVRKPEDRVWALDKHLILWYLELKPISRTATHPSTIVRESIMSALANAGYARRDELQRLMASRPEFLVTSGELTPFYLHRYEAQWREFLEGNYDLFYAGPDIVVYRLRGRD